MLARRHALASVVVPLTLVLAVACLHAMRVVYLLAPSPPPRAPSQDAPREPDPRGFHATSARRILERNPFDSSAKALDAAPRPDDAAPVFERPYAAPPCGDGIVLVGTSVAEPATASIAILSGGSGMGAGSHLVRQRQPYAGRRVWFVAWDRVWLSTETTLCQIETSPRDSHASPAPSASAPEVAGILRRSQGDYVVDRAFVERTLTSPALLRTVRVLPDPEPGPGRGLRVLGLQAGSPLAAGGLEVGDVLRTVNGFDLADPEKALEAYARLRTADRFVLEVLRRGTGVTLRYEVR